jgi:hypothetical protein
MKMNIKSGLRAGAALVLLSLVTACAAPKGPTELIVLLPDSKGKVGTVIVNNGENKTVLNKALAAARVGDGPEQTQAVTLNQEEVDKTFAQALARIIHGGIKTGGEHRLTC